MIIDTNIPLAYFTFFTADGYNQPFYNSLSASAVFALSTEKSQAEEEATKENAAMESGLASSLNSILKKTLSKEIKEGSAEPSETSK